VATSLPLFAKEIQHRFLICNFMGKSLHYVDQFDSAKSWNLDMGYPVFDMQLVGDHQLMVNQDKGYHIYDLMTQKRVRSFSSDKLKGVVSMRKLDDGRTFFVTQSCLVYQFDKEGKFITEYEMPKVVNSVRMMRFAPNGNILLACRDGAFELSLKKGLQPEERVVKQFLLPRPKTAWMALYAPDKTKVYVSGGYSKGFYTFNLAGELLKDTVIEQPKGLHNFFYSGFQILKSGNIVMSNWTGHNMKDFKPGLKLVEFDKDYNVIWSWNEEFGGTVNNVIVLED
jgi:hypothetical protein